MSTMPPLGFTASLLLFTVICFTATDLPAVPEPPWSATA